MEIDELIERHPQVFHMAEGGAWPYIERHGLRSTTALLDLFEMSGPERFEIESKRRPQIVEICHPDHGKATIRDNKPLREQFLIECLVGMSPQQFYELLNRKVFFWVRPERLDMLLGARAYRNRPHDVLTIDTATMIERHGARAALASINTGATLYPSAPQRGPSTFQSITDFDLAEARRRRSNRDAIVELAIDYAVLDVADFVLRVERRRAGRPTQLL